MAEKAGSFERQQNRSIKAKSMRTLDADNEKETFDVSGLLESMPPYERMAPHIAN